MGDRTYCTLTLVAWPEHQLDRILARLSAMGWDAPDASDDGSLTLIQEQGRCGCISELFVDGYTSAEAVLVQEFPGITMFGHENPCYEYLGTFCAYTAGFRVYEGPCDSDGRVVLPYRVTGGMQQDVLRDTYGQDVIEQIATVHRGGY